MLRKVILIVSVLLITFLNLEFTFAALSPISKAPVISKTDLTTANVTWPKVDGALGYYVYYSKESGKNYKMSDPIEESTITLTNLDPNSKYFAIVTAFDENGSETAYSPESSFETKSSSVGGNSSKFGLIDVKVTAFDKIELTFNSDLDNTDGTQREFKITRNLKEVSGVKEAKLDEKDNTKLELVLDKTLTTGEYNLVIISIKSKSGKTIEEGVDGETKFMVPSEFPKVDVPAPTSAEPADTDLNAAKDLLKDAKNDGIFGKKVDTAGSNPDVVAGSPKKLPQSGPEEMFILFLSLILASTFFYFRKRVLVK